MAGSIGRALLDVLSWLGPEDLVAVSQVNREWRGAVLENAQLWVDLCVPESWVRRRTATALLARFVPMA
jgi:hypothetical protein